MALDSDLRWPDGRVATWSQVRDYVLADFPLCAICGQAEATEVDHIWPRYFGGTDETANLQPACGTCNRSKGPRVRAEDATEWQLALAVGACGDRAMASIGELEQFTDDLWRRGANASSGDDLKRVRAALLSASSTLMLVRDVVAVHLEVVRRMSAEIEAAA